MTFNSVMMKPALHLDHVLKKYWGYTAYRPLQKEAMDCVLAGRDSIVVLPTGGGKSLCFQVPAVALPGLAVVVSPLISLMKDQVDSLQQCGVAAARIDSSQTSAERYSVYRWMREDKLKILYLSPERLFLDNFVELLKSRTVSLIAVDEAHCISQWGHDFRPEYRKLGSLKKTFPGIAMHAYTATATERVRQDIAKQLCLEDPEVLVGSFDRPNLLYRVERRTNLLRQVRGVLERRRGESGIIYCIRRLDVDDLCDKLGREGYRVLPYHAGMPDEERKNNQDAFIQDKVDTIVATIAFGMGIDKSNVRYVIHSGMPKSLENYQQESGRAGRDGLEAECCLFYDEDDYEIWQLILKETSSAAQKSALQKLEDMYGFCRSSVCRHRALVQYFGQDLEPTNCLACDVCLGRMESVKDSLVTAQKILSCVKRLKEGFGASYTTLVLRGERTPQILTHGHHELSTFSLLAHESQQTILQWIDQLAGQGYLVREGEYQRLKVTPTGTQILLGKINPRLYKAAPVSAPKSRKERGVAKPVDEALFEELRRLRRDIAESQNIPAYTIFNDASLRDMASRRPVNKKEFRECAGVGQVKNKKYGRHFTRFIRDYLDKIHGPHTHSPVG